MKLRIHILTLCAAIMMVGAFALTQEAKATGTTPPPPVCKIDCPKSPGFWMNHPEAWPRYDIIPGICNANLIYYMKAPVKGNKVLTLLPALVAAYLNFINCEGPDEIGDAITKAYKWIQKYGFVYNEKGKIICIKEVRANEPAWQKGGECLYLILDAYNNGYF